MRAAKIDSTHKAIVEALRKAGAGVQSLAPVGKGCPDLLVSYRQRWHVIECKTLKGKLRQSQRDWMHEHGVNVVVLRSIEDVQVFLQTVG